MGDILFLQRSSEVGLILPISRSRRTFTEIRTRDDFLLIFHRTKVNPYLVFLFAKDSCHDVSTIPLVRFARKLLAIRILDKN